MFERLGSDALRHVVRRRSTLISGWHRDLGILIGAIVFLAVQLIMRVFGLSGGFFVALPVFIALIIGMRWRLVVDARGFSYAVTWLGLPMWRWRFPVDARFGIDKPLDGKVHIWLGTLAMDYEHDRLFGTPTNAGEIEAAMRAAVARHHVT